MNTLEAIASRRSIRRFQGRPVPRELIEQVLTATVQAPSAKNTQPWRFVVLEGLSKDALVQILKDHAARLKALGEDRGSLRRTVRSMSQAPVCIAVLQAPVPEEVPARFHDDYHFVMLQSIGGAIQTLLLAAQEVGLGSLWICDILYSAQEVLACLGRPDHRLIAAVLLGYAAEAPGPRPRHPWAEVTEWRPSPV